MYTFIIMWLQILSWLLDVCTTLKLIGQHGISIVLIGQIQDNPVDVFNVFFPQTMKKFDHNSNHFKIVLYFFNRGKPANSQRQKRLMAK